MIQKENKIFPHVVPGPPESEADILEWARDLSFSVTEINRLLVDKFNLHTANTHAHPNMWANSRARRPQFRSNPADLTQIIFDADSANPILFDIDGVLYEVTSDLVLDMDTAGPGGLRTGLTKTANTVYYVYAVYDDGSVNAIIDTNPPSTGPTGYSVWQYVGSFVSTTGGDLDPFVYRDGLYLQESGSSAQEVSQANTTLVSKTLLIPATARAVYGRVNFSAINAAGDTMSIGSTSATALVRLRTGTTTVGQSPVGFCWVPVITANTVWMNTNHASTTGVFRPLGWVEEPTDYP